ncbi:MAG: hypothetical protein IPI30_22715 [Saprospiraceae bacterium]|nr:hypothetical protein [Candidatus Vicinibacter affinis]
MMGINWVPAEVFGRGSFDECYYIILSEEDGCRCVWQVGEDDWGPEAGFFVVRM